MIKLDISKEKPLQFEVNIQGIDYTKLKGSIRVLIDNVEYGFPIKISENEITTTLPPLKEIVKKGLVNESIIKANLDIFGEGFYLNPWSDEVMIDAPVLVESKLINEKEISTKKSIDVNLISSEKVDEKSTMNESCGCMNEETIEDDFNIDSFPEKDEKQTGQISDPEVIHTIAKARSKARVKTMYNIVDRLLKSRGVSQVGESKKKCKKKSIQKENKKIINKPKTITEESIQKENKKIINKPKTITEESIFNLMESYGLKNSKIQKLLLIKAQEVGLGDLNNTYDAVNKMLTKKETI